GRGPAVALLPDDGGRVLRRGGVLPRARARLGPRGLRPCRALPADAGPALLSGRALHAALVGVGGGGAADLGAARRLPARAARPGICRLSPLPGAERAVDRHPLSA